MPNRILIIGAGPGGYVAAVRAAQLEAEVTVVESGQVGGTCLNYGCIPSKVLKTAAEFRYQLRQSEHFGFPAEQTQGVNFDLAMLMARKQNVIQIQAQGIANLLKKHKITFIQGHARITGMHQAKIKSDDGSLRSIAWDRLILATGTRPRALEGMPFDGDTILSNEHVLSLEKLPQSVLIVGGGVIGCEFASMLAALGVKVTIAEALPGILPLATLDQECATTLAREMKKQKIGIHAGHVVKRIDERAEAENDFGQIRVCLEPSESIEKTTASSIYVDVEKVIVAIGRDPHLKDLGIASIGIKTDAKGWIEVDEGLRTNITDVYAIGDILGPKKYMLAHVASAEGIKAAENACGRNVTMDYRAIPGAVFTMPEIACVGLTQAQAEKQAQHDNGAIRSDKVLFRSLAKAHIENEISGFVKIISDCKDRRLLGMHIIGPHATELIAEGTQAIWNRFSVETIANTIHAHPTLSEVVMETAMMASDRVIHG